MATGFMSPISLITQMLSDQGVVGAGFQLFLFQAGTSTPATTFTSSSLSVTNSNPIVMATNGRWQNVSIWTPAGTVLKMVWEDANSNVIPGLTIDNIPALNDITAVAGGGQVTFYGGADSGAANAYVLTFTAPFFTGLTNGNEILWIPGHTNTTASTLNVNGLGVTPIVNVDGTAVTAGQIQAGQPTQVVFYNGNWVLIDTLYTSGPTTIGGNLSVAGTLTVTNNVAFGKAGANTLTGFGTTAVAQVDMSPDKGTFTATLTGFASSHTGTVNFWKQGGLVLQHITASITGGDSNSTSFGFSGIPAEIQTSAGATQEMTSSSFVDNAVVNVLGSTQMNSGSNNLTFKKANTAAAPGPTQFTSGGWTGGSTLKGIQAGWMMIYSLT